MAAGVVLNAKLVYAACCSCRVPATCCTSCGARPPESPPSRARLVESPAIAAGSFLPFAGLVAAHNYIKTGSPFPPATGAICSLAISGLRCMAMSSSGQSVFLYSPPLLWRCWACGRRSCAATIRLSSRADARAR